MNSKVVPEAVKQFLRTVLISIVPLGISMLQNNNWDWKLVWVTGAIAALMAIDRAVHVSDAKANGIVGF